MKKSVPLIILTSLVLLSGCQKKKQESSEVSISHYVTMNEYEFDDIGLQDYQLERLWTIFDSGIGKYTKGEDSHIFEICQNNDLIIYSKKIYAFSTSCYTYYEINLVDNTYTLTNFYDKLYEYYDRMAECLGYLTSLAEYVLSDEASLDFVSSLEDNGYVFNNWTTINNVNPDCLNLSTYVSYENRIDQSLFVGAYLNYETRFRSFPIELDAYLPFVNHYSLFRDSENQVEHEISLSFKDSMNNDDVNSLMNVLKGTFDELNKETPLSFINNSMQEAFLKGSIYVYNGHSEKGKKDIVLKDTYTFSFTSIIKDNVKTTDIHLDISYAIKAENESNEYYEIKADGVHTNVGDQEIVVPQNLSEYSVTLAQSDN